MERSERFGLVLSEAEKTALEKLAERERLPAAAVVRRLLWAEAERLGLIPGPGDDRHRRQEAQDD